jgi:diamine N-acetyltransferase
MTPVELRPITKENWLEALSLGVDAAQRRFVAGVEPVAAIALAKAYVRPGGKTLEPYGIYHENTMVGCFNLHYTLGSPHDYWLLHFFIDQRFQGRQFGTQAIVLLAQHLQDHHPLCRRLSLTVHPDNRAAQHFYQKLAFADGWPAARTAGHEYFAVQRTRGLARSVPLPRARGPALWRRPARAALAVYGALARNP